MHASKLRQEIIEAARSFNDTGLSVGTSGNVSARSGRNFIITPSALHYADLTPHDLVELDASGKTVYGKHPPSSEWRFHRDIYAARADVNAIVHVHSAYATAVACTGRAIPAFHYMVAKAGGNEISCARYATFGTEELSRNAVTALADRGACLLANHGMIAVGAGLHAALDMARDIEELARQYCYSLQIGGPQLLDEGEMQVNVEKFRHYGEPEGQA